MTMAMSEDRARDLRFVRRVHRLRTLGLGLGFFCVASVMRLHQESRWLWGLLVADGFVWPHAARLLALRSSDPQRAEFRNLMADSALGGMWVAVMGFNLLPSALLVTMLSVDKIAVGGVPLLLRTTAWLAVACALTSALLGFPVYGETPLSVVLACLPFLGAYPLAISTVTHRLATRVARQNRLLEELTRTDGLTRLLNRQHWLEVAEGELQRHRRTGRPAVLLMLDVDRFKDINDRHGHPVGDEVLCGVAQVLRACARAIDTPARFGGDEFGIVLPETDLRGAEEAAQRIRERLEALTFERAPSLRPTISLGAAEASADLRDVDAWIKQADDALYRAKAAGRNRFVGAPARRAEG